VTRRCAPSVFLLVALTATSAAAESIPDSVAAVIREVTTNRCRTARQAVVATVSPER
jgi:hypothetical protein